MEKYEYKIRSEEITKLINEERYAEAVKIADTIDWRRVKSSTMLLKISALYRVNKRNEDGRDILLLAYDRYPTNRSVVYSLCELSIELDDVLAAIKYYKQFAKIAPDDSGVYTLRYRILEAQEASLEERIAILEDLKIKDYQEEWVYELAYLYHRVGLATKCVEICDELILWIGDGPYVMKAMELKQLHLPLTPEQQAKYNFMLGNAQGNYSAAGYDDQDQGYYDENGNFVSTSGGDGNEGYASDYNYDEGYSENEGYASNYDYNEGYDQNYDPNYDENGNYIGNESYASNYDENYDAGYDENGNYIGNEGYASDYNYNEGYSENEGYASNYDYNEGYEQNYDPNYDENGNYIGPSEFSDDEFYSEQVYDELGNPIETPQDNKDNNDVDMSQYNTINLQKVVAESMRELFPDDDIFAEEREKLNSEPSLTSEDSQATDESETSPSEQQVPASTIVYGRFGSADTDDSVVESTSAVEQTGVIFNKTDNTDIESTTSENTPMTGQIKLDDVLDEWEKMKEDNAKHRQEEIRNQIFTQTGQMFKDFDNSVNNDIMSKLDDSSKVRVKGGSIVIKPDVPEFEDVDELLEQVDDGVEELEEVNEVSDINNIDEINETNEADEINEAIEANNEYDAYSDYEQMSELERAVANELGGVTQSIHYETIEAIVDASADAASAEDFEDSYYAANQYVGEETMERSSTEHEPMEDGSMEDGSTEDEETMEYDSMEHETMELRSTEPSTAEQITTEQEYDSTDRESIEHSSLQYTMSWEHDMEAKPDSEIEVHDTESFEAVGRESQTEPVDTSTRELDPDDVEDIEEMAKEDALKTQEIKMNTADLSVLSEKIVETTTKEATGAKREEVREFTPEEQELFENFAVTKKIKKQIINALDNMSLAAYTGNVIITGDAGIDTLRMAKNIIKEYQAQDSNFSGKIAKITGEKINDRNIKEIFDKLDNGGIIIEKANGMNEEKLYEMASLLNQENLGIIVILEDTKKEIAKLLEKQAFIADYFNIRIDLMEMDNNALVAYAKNYALALEYAIDELGTLALYTRIANMQSGNHVVTKDEVRDIIDEAIYKSKKSKIKNFVDVLFSRRYDSEDMIVLRERDFI